MNDLSDRIKALRVARGMTQAQLAAACGVTKAAVSGWERGVSLNIALQPFLALCDALKTDPHYLLFGPDRRPPKASVPPRSQSSG